MAPAVAVAGPVLVTAKSAEVATVELTVAVFSRELLFAWTANPDIMVRAAPVLTLLAIGAAFQAMLLLPYLLQLAAGLTKLSTLTTLAVFVLTIPVTVWASLNWGAVGGAAAWIIYNFVYLLLYLPLMHRRLLVGELPAWLGFDVAAPAVGAGIVLLLFRVLWTAPTNRWLCALMLSVVGAVALVAAAACAGRVRRAVAQFIRAFTTRKLRPRTQN